MDLPEVVDFSNDTWSYKGDVPVYQIQSDGFSYDVVDADGNDKNAISLGISGMLIIVLNAKDSKIREEELLPPFGKVIKTHNWHTMTVKEANFLVQTAIKKLSSSSMSGDVFDLASYAPLEVKRVLLKTLFTISRTQFKPEFREEAEHRIIDDIVPAIFANPEYELASLTGLIVKPEKAKEQKSERLETRPVLDADPRYSRPIPETIPAAGMAGEDSAFAQLQRIYGRSPESVPAAPAAVSQPEEEKKEAPNQAVPAVQQAAEEKPSEPSSRNDVPNAPQTPAPNFGAPQPNNPFARVEPQSIPQQMPNFSAPQPNNPFAQSEPRNIPQPPNFGAPQPNNPFMSNEGRPGFPQNAGIPQPPVPGFGMQPNNPYGNMNMPVNVPAPNQGFPQQVNPFQGGYPPYPGQQPWQQQNPQQGQMPVQGAPQPFYPGQMRQPYPPQMPQNMGGTVNPQRMNPGQPSSGSDTTTSENA